MWAGRVHVKVSPCALSLFVRFLNDMNIGPIPKDEEDKRGGEGDRDGEKVKEDREEDKDKGDKDEGEGSGEIDHAA